MISISFHGFIAIDSATITRTTDGSPQRKSNLPSNCLLAAVMREKPKRTMVYPVYVYINYLSIYLSQVLLAGATVVPSPGSPVSTPRPATSSSGSTTACKTTDKMLNDINALKKKLSAKRQIKAKEKLYFVSELVISNQRNKHWNMFFCFFWGITAQIPSRPTRSFRKLYRPIDRPTNRLRTDRFRLSGKMHYAQFFFDF